MRRQQSTTARTKARASSWFVLVLALSLVALACGASTSEIDQLNETSSTQDGAQPGADEPEPTAEPAPTPTSEPAQVATAEPAPTPEPTETPEPLIVYWGSEIEPGDCINRVEGNPVFEPPTIVPCNELHEEEIYAKTTLDFGPDEPFPGSDELVALISAELCDEATLNFAGEAWDVAPIDTWILYPLEEEWDAGDRFAMCSASPPDGITYKIGTAAGGTIDTDDALVARAALTDDGRVFDDWIVITELTTIESVGSLTDGQFDLPLRRPFPVAQGFIFNALPADGDTTATGTWGYAWATGELTDLGSILPGQELASTVVANGSSIFAARATPTDDWDIWTAKDGVADVLVGGEGDQQFPTLTPDQSQVVYQDSGDIWIVNVDGSDPRQLTSGPGTDFESIVSPDGSTVVFASDRSGNDDLWSVSIDGGEAVNLTNHPADEFWPVFSPDGSYIYFSSDRLKPEDNRARVMVMNPDGSNQSWFAGLDSSQAIMIDPAVAADVVAGAPTLNDRYTYERITGEEGTTTNWAHSSERLAADLPAGWLVSEIAEGIGFVTGPSVDRYYETWSADGVLVVLLDGETQDEFFARYDDELAVQDCEQFDGTGEIVPLEEPLLFLSGNFNCGDDGAVAGVLMFYNTETNVGVVLQGQRDNLPDPDSDSELITAIARSLAWQ